jgi:6-phosphofructokinase 1
MPDRSLPPDLPAAADLTIRRIGEARYPSPLAANGHRFVADDSAVLVTSDPKKMAAYHASGVAPPAFEEAGPRHLLAVDPATARAGIVTCGGLCPGLNDVIRSLTLTLHYSYRVEAVVGYRFGYAGLVPALGFEPLPLTPAAVETIHEYGGTLLGSSRGPQDVAVMVDTLLADRINLLFCVGGDGTLRGASAIAAEAERRSAPLAVIGIPKTIDNDLFWVERSFGFATAVEEAVRAIRSAHAEARGAWNGIGIVKLMGRHAGFIAVHATLASNDVNLCLVPEVPFRLERVVDALEARLRARHHAVVVVAEGAGQELVTGADPGVDPSGNRRLADIGTHLRDALGPALAHRGVEPTIKYIDPSYLIRSVRANAVDAEFCLALGQEAAHAALSGRTDAVIGYWHNHATHVPIALATGGRRHVDTEREDWRRVLQTTGQPATLS